MRHQKFAITAIAAALSVAFAIAPADARHRKHAGAWTLGVLPAGDGYVYGPHYGYPHHPSYWYGPTTGVYPVPASSCYAPRATPWIGQWWWQSTEYIC
jgi:hypothetical protein